MPEPESVTPVRSIDWPTTIAVWGARVVWLALAVFGGAAIGDALAPHSRAVQLTGTIGAWIVWAVVAVALVVPSTISLTAARMAVPASLVGAVVAVVGQRHHVTGVHAATCVGLALLATAFVASAELGQVFAQASAYGEERRFVLRPPAGLLLPIGVMWALWCAALLSGPLLLAARAWIAGVLLTALAGVLTWLLGRSLHRLSRRWLVVVPTGLVVHDHVVLAETAMFPVNELAGVSLALADTEAADLTGPAGGHAIEIRLTSMPTVVLAANRTRPGGTALHVRAVLVAPSRPGRALAEAQRRR